MWQTFLPWRLKFWFSGHFGGQISLWFRFKLLKRVKLKQTFYLLLLCFHHKTFAKSYKQSQFTPKFIPSYVHNIFKQSNMVDRSILGAASSLYKLVTKNFASGDYTYFFSWSPKGDLRSFLISSPDFIWTWATRTIVNQKNFYLSVNVFCTKALQIEDTILHFLLRTGLPLYVVIQAMQRSSHLKGQYLCFSVILTL